jgi:superfamily II DNA helicase RecQ
MWLEALSPHCTVTADGAPPPFTSASSGAGNTNPGQGGNLIDLVNAARRRLARARSPLTHPPTDDPAGDAVAGSLREWRRRVARASGVPAYVILHDSTVELIARCRPMTCAELLALPGIGPVKVNRFGPAVCEVVREALAGATLQEGA